MFSGHYRALAEKARGQAKDVQKYRSGGFTFQQHERSLLTDPYLSVQYSESETNIYHIFFDCDGKTLTLRVKFHRDEIEPPSIKLAGGVLKAKHMWLDPHTLKVIGYMPITSVSKWMSSGLKLNQAIHDIISEFKRNPPNIISVYEKEMREFSYMAPLPEPLAPPVVSESSSSSSSQQDVSVVDQIVKLAELFHQGVLSEDEFKEAKAKLIERM